MFRHSLLTDVLRGELGFSGYVTGDDGSAMEVLTTHKYVATPAEAVAATIRAGMDTDDGVKKRRFGQCRFLLKNDCI